MIEFIEDSHFGYTNRTKRNAQADVTLAFAMRFETAGEKLTKSLVESSGKIYIPILIPKDISELNFSKEAAIAASIINSKIKKSFSLNIAGNGLYTMKSHYSQEECNFIVYNFLNCLFEKLDNLPELIQSGGQTGFDEAGIHAAVKLNIPALIIAPGGWTFRGEKGFDISNEILFKSRF